MSSTDPADPIDPALEGARSAARATLERRGVRLFATAPDPAEVTYFEAPRRARMSPSDFELPGAASPEACLDAARDLWEREGLAELVLLADQLRPFARSYAEDPPESEELSPFVYAMF